MTPMPPASAAPRRRRRDETGSTSSLELMALTPMLALLVLLILWAGRVGRAELVTSLAAEEAAAAAALCCNDAPTPDPHAEPGADARREAVAAAVIASRPGLDYLCVGGPQPAPGSTRYLTTAEADLTKADPSVGLAAQALVVTAHLTCHTDGATAPVRGLFGTRTLHGHGAHVALFASVPQQTDSLPDTGANPDPTAAAEPTPQNTPNPTQGTLP